MIIGVDVDLTVLDPLMQNNGWLDWMHQNGTLVKSEEYYTDLLNNELDYNTGNYFEMNDGVCAFDFWRQHDLYQKLDPYYDAVESLWQLKSLGHDIVYISYCKANHYKSKYLFLREHFPFDGFIATKAKQYALCDVFIDDRNAFLNQSSAEHLIKIVTPYTQCSELNRDVTVCNNWYEIRNKIEEIATCQR